MKVTVITISDRAYRGEYEDLSGTQIIEQVKTAFPHAEIEKEIVPDEPRQLINAFVNNSAVDYIITTGGTGISPRDVTPETTEAYCDKALPGIAEILRMKSYEETPNALLSRGYAGIKASTIIVNFPGSVKAVTLCTSVLIPVMEHGIRMLRGEGHEGGTKKSDG